MSARKFATIWARRDVDFDAAFAAFTVEASAVRAVEYQAAVKIQRCWRRFTLRHWRSHLSLTVTVIQRAFRGFLGRKRLAEILQQRVRTAQRAWYDDMATRVQKVWRGYYSRTRIHSHAARTEYLALLSAKSEAVRAQLGYYEGLQRNLHARETHAALEREQSRIAARVHHLLGTCGIPGVLAKPRGLPHKHDGQHSASPQPHRMLHPSLHVHRPLSPTVVAPVPRKYPKSTPNAVLPKRAASISQLPSLLLSRLPAPFGTLAGDPTSIRPAPDDGAATASPSQPARTWSGYLSQDSLATTMLSPQLGPKASPLRLGAPEIAVLAAAERSLAHDRAVWARSARRQARPLSPMAGGLPPDLLVSGDDGSKASNRHYDDANDDDDDELYALGLVTPSPANPVLARYLREDTIVRAVQPLVRRRHANKMGGMTARAWRDPRAPVVVDAPVVPWSRASRAIPSDWRVAGA
ncbi:hypothetical protein BC828DRAFT_265865 [Blastocladiella britannica]|nr:hypothetical protein BC828DRAFT_265865 [Blastocladiella britannica]